MRIVVIGAGPAGAFAAAASAEAGHDVQVVSPDVHAPWPARYGAWTDELGPAGDLAVVASHTWPAVTVVTPRPTGFGPRGSDDDALRRVIDRSYARVDGVALRAALRRRLHHAGGRAVAARVTDVTADTAAVALAPLQVRLAHGDADPTGHDGGRGRTLLADLVIDASGVPGRAPGPKVLAWQRAWGEELHLGAAAMPASLRGMTLMDWTPPSPRWQARWQEQPTFLYAMELGPGRVFLEETQLSAATPLADDELRARLHARRRRLGVMDAVRVLDVERCTLPMAMAAQPAEAGVVLFGARAGFVHPSTGYSLTWSARQSQRLAQALRGAERAGQSGEAAAARVRAALAIEPRSERLRSFGAALLPTFDGAESAAFFGAFFALPPAQWAAMLGRAAPVGQLMQTMSRVYLAAPASIRRQLRRAAWRDRRRVGAALLGRPTLREVS